MAIAFGFERRVAAPTIGQHLTPRFNTGGGSLGQHRSRSVGHSGQSHPAHLAPLHLRGDQHQSLAARPAPPFARPFPPDIPLVPFPPAGPSIPPPTHHRPPPAFQPT